MVVALIVVLVLLMAGLAVWGFSAFQQERRDAGHEVERKCRRCGATWYLDPKSAREKAPDTSEMGAAKMYRAGKRASLVTTRASAAEMRVHNLEARAERVQQRNACPNCGSASFTETTVNL